MDSAMRDLEQLREQNDGEARPLGLLLMLGGVTVALILAMGLWVSGATEPEEELVESDPLARLDRASGLEASPEPAVADVPEVNRAAFTFPQALLPSDERPEVAAALAAAAAELAHPVPVEQPSALQASLPAAVAAASPSDSFARSVENDPLVAEAIPAAPAGRSAPAGHDGEFTIQVISYDSAAGAESFAAALRTRGHRAFVVSAQVEGRGTMYRVRVGPFETVRDAQAYRQEFERTEHMNTLLVQRREAEG